MVTPEHKQSPKNAVCSPELSHRNKGCDCTVFICHLGDEQGPVSAWRSLCEHVMGATYTPHAFCGVLLLPDSKGKFSCGGTEVFC